jgi:hypothetical protein
MVQGHLVTASVTDVFSTMEALLTMPYESKQILNGRMCADSAYRPVFLNFCDIAAR